MTQPPPPPDATPPAANDGAARLFEEARSASAPGSGRTPPPSVAEIQAHFPDLEIEDVIGQGGMGVVYKARHRRLERAVALKVLPAHLGDDPAFAERFAREARTMARLDHPHIVRVYDFGESGGLYYLVLEYVDGANLREVMRAGHLAPEEAMAIVPQLCEALQYAHDHGVVHRDVKPENVLLDKQAHVKVADFGLAKLAGHDAYDATLTGTGQVMGTPNYMAPEQYKTPQDVDHRADIFSLGVVFYEMLTGELPVGRFRPPSASEAVDARIDAIVFRTLERERDLRYQRASDVESDLTRLSQTGALPPEAGRASSRGTGRLAVLLSALAVPLGFLAVALAHSAWGGVDRGTSEVFHREFLKAGAGSLVWLVGVAAGLLAVVRGARASGRRLLFRAGLVLTVLNLLLVPAIAWYAMTEAERHSELPAAEAPHLAPGHFRSGVEEFWRDVASRLQHGPLSLEEALPLYTKEGQRLLRDLSEEKRASRRRHRELGVAFLNPGDFGGDLMEYDVTSVSRFGRGPVTVTLAHESDSTRASIVFHVVYDESRWHLAVRPVRVRGER